MRRNWKILLTVVLAMITVFVLSIVSYSTEGTQISGTGIYWRVEGTELILEYSGSGSSEIPDFSSNYDQPWYYDVYNVNTITIGEGITRLGNNSFHSMTNVNTINWPTTIRTIGGDVFAMGCYGVDPIVIPEGVTTIANTFFGANPRANHSSITYPSTLTSAGNLMLYGVLKDGGTATFLGEPPTVNGDDKLADHMTNNGIHFVVPYGMTDAYRQILDENWVIDITELPPDVKPSRNESSSHIHNFEWQTIYQASTDKDGLEGEVCTICGETRKTQPLSAYGFSINDYATPMVNASKSGQTVTFELGEWNSFPKAFMEKIAAKSLEGVTFVFHYKWNHAKQEITIPFGTIVDTDFDWYGPAKMAELYGAN